MFTKPLNGTVLNGILKKLNVHQSTGNVGYYSGSTKATKRRVTFGSVTWDPTQP